MKYSVSIPETTASMDPNHQVEVFKNGTSLKFFKTRCDATEFIEKQKDRFDNNYSLVDWN